MVLNSVRYKFTQRFAVPIEKAFEWSLDYQPGDIKLLGHKGKRKVKWLAEDTVVLEDTIREGKKAVTKTRLVRIYHERRFFSNTHVGGSRLHSQFLYEFLPEGEGASRLVFTGLLLVSTKKKLSPEEVSKMALEEKTKDAAVWKSLAAAMEKDLQGS